MYQYGASPEGAPPPPPPLPPGWEPRTDPASRATYFVQTATGRTQWELPAVTHHASPPPAPPHAQPQGYPAARALPHLLASSSALSQAYPPPGGSVTYGQTPPAPGNVYPENLQAPQGQHWRPQQPEPAPPHGTPHPPSYPPQQTAPYVYGHASLQQQPAGYPGAAGAPHPPPYHPHQAVPYPPAAHAPQQAPPVVYPGAAMTSAIHQQNGMVSAQPAANDELHRNEYPGGAPPPPPPDLSYGAPVNTPGAQYDAAQLAYGMSQLSHGGPSLIGQASALHVGSNGRAQTLQLEMSAEGLKGKDLLSKSDPLCVVEIWDNAKWKLVGKTECLKNTHDPHWTTRVNVPFIFVTFQRMRFRVMDADSGKLRSDDTLGVVDAPLADIVRVGAMQFRLEKKKVTVGTGKGLGILTVRAHETDTSSGGLTRVRLKLSARKLDRADGPFSKSDPYFVIENTAGFGPGVRSTLCKSEVVMNSLSPSWQQVSFLVNSYGRPPHEVDLDIRLMDFDKVSKHDSLGSARCSLAALASAGTLDVINEAKRKKKGSKYVNSGTLSVDSASVTALPSFVSYIMGGCRLRFTCAVDFTASNGKPENPRSLHYSDGVTQSLYAQALEAVGIVVSRYLSDGLLEAYGFGATVGASRTPSFDFPLRLDVGPNGDARVLGVSGLKEAYTNCVRNVNFSGPTNFAPILSKAMHTSSRPSMPAQHDQHYTVLLILTDGQCTDMSATIDKIVDASATHPLSIVIVGVGSADFSAMEFLDGDNKTLSGSSGRASRDIVQFVRWKPEMPPSQLASEVLAEIPTSLVEFMSERGIVPNAPGPVYPQPQY